LQIDVIASGLPAGAATLLEQQTQTTALQLIDNLVAALQSVATDRLIVGGEDQLFSYKTAFANQKSGVISGAGGYYDSNTPPAGEVWVVTNVMSLDWTTATTLHRYSHVRGANDFDFGEARGAFAAAQRAFYHGRVWLEAGDVVRVYFTGGLAGDTCFVHLIGHTMTKEV